MPEKGKNSKSYKNVWVDKNLAIANKSHVSCAHNS